MNKVIRVDDSKGELYGWMFWCPGCDMPHCFMTTWKFNGDTVNPTFQPSLLVWWDEGEQRIPKRCHSFVTNGQIQYLQDSTHHLAGQTVTIPNWDDT